MAGNRSGSLGFPRALKGDGKRKRGRKKGRVRERAREKKGEKNESRGTE